MRSNPASWQEFQRSHTWNSFPERVPTSCRRAQERDRRAILIQCFMRFRVCCHIKDLAPFPQFDGHAHDLTEDFCLLGIT
jgi:hypothetical protein